MPAVIQVDASDLKRVVENLRATARGLPRVLEYNLTRSINIRLILLKQATPVGERADSRWPDKLIDSYSIERGPGERSITTSVPLKLTFVTQGTRPHPIDPRNREALSWPTLYLRTPYGGGKTGAPSFENHTVSHVYHPGTQANDFVNRATMAYSMLYGGDPADGMIAMNTVKYIVRGVTAKTFSESLSGE